MIDAHEMFMEDEVPVEGRVVLPTPSQPIKPAHGKR